MTPVAWLLILSLQTAGNALVTGTIRDGTGDVVPGATIVLREAAGAEEQTTAGPDGRFSVTIAPEGEFVLIVRAPGFAEHRQSMPPGAGAQPLQIVLAPAPLTETVTVTAARTEQLTRNVAASVNLLEREEIERSPAVVADDVLRQIPTFSLFRRTSSLAAHPTAQGVSLRGVGPSGVSRTLVLLDGIPLNDPFGGWVYWTRVPLESVERIEVVDGATSSVYGNYAMGGVINVVTSAPIRGQLDVRSQYGTRTSPKLDVSAGTVRGRMAGAIDAAVFSTDGYPIVAPAERGAVDENAAVSFQNIAGRLQYGLGGRGHAFLRAGHFRERRDNGKISTIDGREEANDTRWTTASGGLRARLPDTSDLQINVFADFARFRSNFLAVPAAAPPRSIGRMTLDQRVPTRGVGGMTQWSRAFGGKHFVTTGLDWRWVDGDSEEDALDPLTGTRVTLSRISGGTQRSLGAFVQDLFSPVPRLTVTVAARLDRWRNSDGHNLEVDAGTGLPTANHRPSLPDRSDSVISPRVAALFHLSDTVTVWGDLGAGFRAPTLNELYRQFRVGTVLTLANDQLGPERLVGGNAGVRITPFSNFSLRTTWYDNRVEDPVSNVTISAAGANVTQQRQNLGRTRVSGIQTEVDYRLASYRVSAGYMHGRARVVEFAANPSLVGNSLPQVPRHRATLQLAWVEPRIAQVAIALQAVGRQFDDDQNIRVVPGQSEPGLPGFMLVEMSVSRRLSRKVQVFAGAQNLLDREYYVGTLPTTVGTPRLVHVGVRVRFD